LKERERCYWCEKIVGRKQADAIVVSTQPRPTGGSPDDGLWMAHMACFEAEYMRRTSVEKLRSWRMRMAEAIAMGS
jgi:hypothetical protein